MLMFTLFFLAHAAFRAFYKVAWGALVFSSLLTNVHASDIKLSVFTSDVLGKHIEFFQEHEKPLSVQESRAMFSQGKGVDSTRDSIALGIGVDPVWLSVTVNNDINETETYRLSVETPWLDHIDSWLLHESGVIQTISGGDAIPFNQRPMQYRHYAFEYQFKPGKTQILIRVQSLGPMAIPVRLSTVNKAVERDIASAYQYGFLYGVMSALALYNLVLYAFIRQREFGLYGLYLAGFVLNSLSYTGQLHTVFTPDYGKYFQDWLDIFLMITYSVAGLHFARALLGTKSYAPRLDKSIVLITIVIPVGMLIGFLLNQLVFSMSLAFILNCGFVTLFVAMGFYALKAKKPMANLFLISSVTAALCITVSTLAVAGFLVPYNDYTFKLIEVGMAFEAVLLAVILAKQFRMAQADKILAQSYARADSLTALNNRRGFQEAIKPIWLKIVREQRDASIVLFDIDDFKQVNDNFGHSGGDAVLKKVAEVINNTMRQSDISARWGGEEFILMLPETSLEQAAVQAERLRCAIEQTSISVSQQTVSLSASFGVAGSIAHKVLGNPLGDYTLESIINDADRALYKAKENGKNQIQLSSLT